MRLLFGFIALLLVIGVVISLYYYLDYGLRYMKGVQGALSAVYLSGKDVEIPPTTYGSLTIVRFPTSKNENATVIHYPYYPSQLTAFLIDYDGSFNLTFVDNTSTSIKIVVTRTPSYTIIKVYNTSTYPYALLREYSLKDYGRGIFYFYSSCIYYQTNVHVDIANANLTELFKSSETMYPLYYTNFVSSISASPSDITIYIEYGGVIGGALVQVPENIAVGLLKTSGKQIPNEQTMYSLFNDGGDGKSIVSPYKNFTIPPGHYKWNYISDDYSTKYTYSLLSYFLPFILGVAGLTLVAYYLYSYRR